jgi:hypothetical protein
MRGKVPHQAMQFPHYSKEDNRTNHKQVGTSDPPYSMFHIVYALSILAFLLPEKHTHTPQQQTNPRVVFSLYLTVPPATYMQDALVD